MCGNPKCACAKCKDKSKPKAKPAKTTKAKPAKKTKKY